MSWRSYAAMTSLFLAVLVGAASAERIELPSGIFYYQPAASVFGAEAAWVNPAGLAAYRTPSFQILTDYADTRLAKSWGGVIGRERMAVAYRQLYVTGAPNYQEYIFAAALSFQGNLYAGGSYRYMKDAPDFLARKHFWNIGLVGGSASRVRWAAVLSNLNRARMESGARSETEMRYSLALRPMGKSITVAADMMLSTGTRLSNADFVYYAEYAAGKGISLHGAVDNDGNFAIGARVNLANYFAGSQSNYDNGGHHQSTTFITGGTSLRQASLIPPSRRRLDLSLQGEVPENPEQPYFGRREPSFTELILGIYRAAADPSIGEMVLNMRSLSLGLGRGQELREALAEFRSHGKRIICHLSYPGNLDYYVASIADSILMDPVAQLNLVGLRAELTFYAGTFDKLGITVDMVRYGDYKSAAERYTNRESSPATREQLDRLLDNLYEQFVAGIATARGLSTDSLRVIIDNGPYTSAEAVACGLVDGLSYRDQLSEARCAGLPTVTFRAYESDTLVNDGWPALPVLAVVVADGDIAPESSEYPFAGGANEVTPGRMNKALQQAVSNPAVRATVLRIDSPGGAALASEEIRHSVDRARRRKPLVVSMAGQAASGGFYIATAAQRLFANPACFTGSIGIYAGKPSLEGLYSKIGLGKELYTRGRHAGMMTLMRPFTDDERAKFNSEVQAFYDHFVELVAQNRGLSTDSVDNLSQGRVWTGQQALAIGLVDELGGIKNALDYTAAQMRLKDYDVVVLPRRRIWFELPANPLWQFLSTAITGRTSDRSGELPLALPEGGLYARLPYDLVVE